MKKIILFFILIFLPTIVNGEEHFSYKYHDNAYIKVETERETKTFLLQSIKKNSNNELMFSLSLENVLENQNYQETNNIESCTTLSKNQIERIKALAYQGYLNNSRNNYIWYATTQYLIYKTVYPNYNFSISYNNSFTDISYDAFIKEVELSLEKYQKLSIPQDFRVSLNEKKTFINDKYLFNDFIINNEYKVKTDINKRDVDITGLSSGNGYLEFQKEFNYFNKTFNYYYLNNSCLLEQGDLEPLKKLIPIIVEGGIITINQFTENNIINNNDAVYELSNLNNEVIDTIDLKQKNTTIDLNYGKYYLKQINNNSNYLLNEEIKTIDLNEFNKNIIFDLTKEKEEIKKEKIIDLIPVHNQKVLPDYEENPNTNINYLLLIIIMIISVLSLLLSKLLDNNRE